MAPTFDEILVKHVGEFGKYQIIRILLLSSTHIFLCFTSMSAVFISDDPNHHCQLPSELLILNCTHQQKKEYAIPVVIQDNTETKDQCHLFKKDYANATEDYVCPPGEENSASTKAGKISALQSGGEKFKCDSWHFDASVYQSTVVTEWNLVCDQAWLAKNTAGLYMAARIIGTAACGWLADK